MFKAGDVVIIVDNKLTEFNYGQIFKIREVTEDGFITLMESNDWDHYSVRRFILASPLMQELV